MRHRSLVLAALLAAFASSYQAAAETVLDRVRREGVVHVGFPNQVPYAYADAAGNLTGADAEVARLVFAKLGIPRMDGVLTEFASLIPGLKAERFDAVLAMFVNPARCAQVAFSEPIYGIGQAMVVKQGNPAHIASYDDLAARKDLTLALMAGAVQAGYARAAGIGADRVQSYPDGPSALAAVAAGRASAFGISSLPARRLLDAAGAGSGVQLVEGFPDPVIDGKPARGFDAFAFRKDDADLLAAFNTALAGVAHGPALLDAMAPFGFTADNLPGAISTASLCK